MIEVNKKYGCLTVLDNGEEYKSSELHPIFVEEYKKAEEAARSILDMIDALKKMVDDNPELMEIATHTRYPSTEKEEEFFEKNRELTIKINYESEYDQYRKARAKVERHYKCQCKCGKIHYFNQKTILSNPRYCFYPVSIADNQFSHSNSAKNATHRKEQKYKNVENVMLWRKSPSGAPWYLKMQMEEPADRSLPSEDYCELYNKYKEKQLLNKEKDYQIIVSELPRVNSKNYDIDYTGKQYESLYIEKCVDDHLESKPHFSYRQPMHGQKRKQWHDIIVYKQYKCVCTVCGREQLITCDRFGIYPPTDYGYHAFFGYWSDVRCDCHPISAFQWIVTKLLMDNNVPYKVEYTFDDLYGVHGKNKLRFDFAILNKDGSLRCLIECQGEQHFKPVDEFGGERQFEEQKKNDQFKREYAKVHNIQLIEISYKDKAIEKVEEILIKQDIIHK